MKRRSLYILSAILSLIFLILISTLSVAFVFYSKQGSKTISNTNTVYVYVSENIETSPVESESEDGWLVQTYNDKIGIFDKHGTLIQVLDVYIKTLPKVDQAELQEGFWIRSEKELYSIIEAYSD